MKRLLGVGKRGVFSIHGHFCTRVHFPGDIGAVFDGEIVLNHEVGFGSAHHHHATQGVLRNSGISLAEVHCGHADFRGALSKNNGGGGIQSLIRRHNRCRWWCTFFGDLGFGVRFLANLQCVLAWSSLDVKVVALGAIRCLRVKTRRAVRLTTEFNGPALASSIKHERA